MVEAMVAITLVDALMSCQKAQGELFADETPVEIRRIQWEQVHIERMGQIQIERLLVFLAVAVTNR